MMLLALCPEQKKKRVLHPSRAHAFDYVAIHPACQGHRYQGKPMHDGQCKPTRLFIYLPTYLPTYLLLWCV